MTILQKLGVCSAAALMMIATFSGCCSHGGCSLGGGAKALAPAASSCSSCSQQAYSEPASTCSSCSQGQTYSPESSYGQPVYESQGAPVSAGSGTVNAPSFSNPIQTPSFGGSGTTTPSFGGGSGSR